MPAPCSLGATPPGTFRKAQLATLCACGFERRYHTLGHPHGFTGPTPSCHGFQDRHTVARRTAGRGGAIVAPYDTHHYTLGACMPLLWLIGWILFVVGRHLPAGNHDPLPHPQSAAPVPGGPVTNTLQPPRTPPGEIRCSFFA